MRIEKEVEVETVDDVRSYIDKAFKISKKNCADTYYEGVIDTLYPHIMSAIDVVAELTKKACEEEIECREKELKEYSEKYHKQGNEIARLEEEIEELKRVVRETEKDLKVALRKCDDIKANQKEDISAIEIAKELRGTVLCEEPVRVKIDLNLATKIGQIISSRFGTSKKVIGMEWTQILYDRPEANEEVVLWYKEKPRFAEFKERGGMLVPFWSIAGIPRGNVSPYDYWMRIEPPKENNQTQS